MLTAVTPRLRVTYPLRALSAWLRATRLARARRQRVQLMATRVQWLEERLPGEAEHGDDVRYCSRGYDLMERGSALLVRWSERPSPLLDASLRQWHLDFERLQPDV
ncbi:hypothetical protein [Ferrimonas balearica]|uniref:hypothetical protein n=1 Tax=Ferrimonas balearica TaxID=44012 RepID=UPI001C5876CA|nr:hypothetical protein [Ferrimonas balearica]MBW3165376.1 hypothetical protein [Ferrimonas balearica]MBY6107548.1 hypothetical protein [Ferrimonas balearica]MBY6226330.1 hypothetical protein [Ferrimonas balearica]